jgi:hypothetical protein
MHPAVEIAANYAGGQRDAKSVRQDAEHMPDVDVVAPEADDEISGLARVSRTHGVPGNKAAHHLARR